MYDDTTPFPDEVPVDDAVEQLQPAADPVSADEDDLAGATPPLESDPSDWQEQHQLLDDPEDDRR
ncbi:MAG: hypothetical protein K0R68_3268 [Mycobacterium sp.]|jgi:hypothetical protein|nr:hypothetical protein [Mycobacterium sp.]